MAKFNVTPEGKFYWVKVNNKVDEYEGKVKYSLVMKFSKSDTKKLLKEITETFQARVDEKKDNDKLWKNIKMENAKLGYNEKDDSFRFWCYKEGKNEDGSVYTRKIPIIVQNSDGTGRLLKDSELIANESAGKVAFTIAPFCRSSFSYGVSLILQQVLVTNFIPYKDSNDPWSVFGIKKAEGVPESVQENDTEVMGMKNEEDNEEYDDSMPF